MRKVVCFFFPKLRFTVAFMSFSSVNDSPLFIHVCIRTVIIQDAITYILSCFI